MAWQFQQSTGQMTDPNGNLVATGYTGNNNGLNNPADQFVQNSGPIPQGNYTIGPPHMPVDHLGPMALPLYADPANDMGGRFGFFCHGDNNLGNQSASDGCIIMEHDIREQMNNSDDKALVVIA